MNSSTENVRTGRNPTLCGGHGSYRFNCLINRSLLIASVSAETLYRLSATRFRGKPAMVSPDAPFLHHPRWLLFEKFSFYHKSEFECQCKTERAFPLRGRGTAIAVDEVSYNFRRAWNENQTNSLKNSHFHRLYRTPPQSRIRSTAPPQGEATLYLSAMQTPRQTSIYRGM